MSDAEYGVYLKGNDIHHMLLCYRPIEDCMSFCRLQAVSSCGLFEQ